MIALIKSSIGTKFISAWGDMMCKLALDSVRTVSTEINGKREVDIKRYAKVEKVIFIIWFFFFFFFIFKKNKTKQNKNDIYIYYSYDYVIQIFYIFILIYVKNIIICYSQFNIIKI